MTTPVGHAGNRGAQLDATLRAITDTDAGTTARHAPGQHQTASVPSAVAGVVVDHAPITLTEAVLEAAGAARPAHALGLYTVIAMPLELLGHVVEDADERGAATRAGLHHDRMRGALAVLEGRAGSDEVRMEMARNPSYADGVRRAENLARTMSTQDLQALVAFVRRSGNEGQAAVCLGRDRGMPFVARYTSDAAFAHGVDFARRLRDADPEGFAARTARFTELEAQQTAARQSTAIRP